MSTFRVQGVLGLDGTGFYRTIQGAEMSMSRFNASMGRALTSRLAGFFAVGSLGLLVRRSTEYAGKLVDMAARTGESVEALQRFDRAAKENGSTLEDLVSFWDRLDRARSAALKNPTGPQAAAFGALGIGSGALGNTSAADLSRNISTRLQASANVEPMLAALQQIGGRGVGRLVAAFRNGLDQMYQDIQVMTAEQAYLMDEIDDKWSTLADRISIRLAPALVYLLQPVESLSFLIIKLGYSFAGIGKIITEMIGAFWDALTGGKGLKAAFNDAAVAAQNTHVANAESFKGMVAKWAEDRERAEKSRADRIALMRRRGNLEFSPLESPTKKTGTSIASDALIAVGNFLGKGGQSTLASIAAQQLTVARSQDRHLANIEEKLSNIDSDGGADEFLD